jgi:endoglucanase
MRRKDFLKISSSAIAAATLPSIGIDAKIKQEKTKFKFPRYRGFNLTQKTGGNDPKRKFDEEDFEIMTEFGFDFARIPMSYWNWSKKGNWYDFDEEVMKDIDEVVEFGKQYSIHINLNFHRVPGYCINGRDLEPVDLFDDTPGNMQKALDGVVYQWRYFAKRYKGIPSTKLSFDLINEPPKNTNEERYTQIIEAVVNGIRDVDPDRLIVVDGKDIGRNPLMSIADLVQVQSTRGYDPMSVSHYTATWVPNDEFETFDFPTWPIMSDNGKLWDKEALREKLITRWQPLVDKGVSVHVGEWGCYNKTPHDVVLKWMRDILSLWKEVNWGYAMWNLKGDFGIINSNRKDVKYEDYKGYKLDRQMLELLKQF